MSEVEKKTISVRLHVLPQKKSAVALRCGDARSVASIGWDLERAAFPQGGEGFGCFSALIQSRAKAFFDLKSSRMFRLA